MKSQLDHELSPGTVIDGRFEVREVLGRGGFATVYRCVQLNINREVALKLFDPRVGQTSEMLDHFKARFLLEAKAAANVDHPDIVTIHDFGLYEDEQPYIVMEKLKGRDLRAELSLNGPISPQRLLPLFVRCLDGLTTGSRL